MFIQRLDYLHAFKHVSECQAVFYFHKMQPHTLLDFIVVLESEPRTAEGTLVPLNVTQSWFILEPYIFKCIGVSSKLLIYVHLNFCVCGNLEIPYSSLE